MEASKDKDDEEAVKIKEDESEPADKNYKTKCIEEAAKKMDSPKSKGEQGETKVKEVQSKTGDKDSKTKSKDGKSTDASKKKGKLFKPPTKVVVRRLPPSMTEEEFLQQVEPLPPVDFMYFVQADNSLAPNNFCRAYLNFVNQQDIFIFTQKFDNYVFVDNKGIEYPAVVEFAPFQRIPKQRPNKKKDSKSGTLETDPFYVSFLEKLEIEAQEMSSANNNAKQHFFETNVDTSEATKVSTTPLLEFLHNKYQERRRLREEKRKKDIERKKAKDEFKKAAKKDEETPPIVKVLHGNAAGKDKLKDKENSHPTFNKKRPDEKVRENRVRVWKSYQDEKPKQVEKREDQKRKPGLGKSQKSSNDETREEDQITKDNEDVKDDEDYYDEKTEKVQDEEKDTSENSTTTQKKVTSGQAYQEYQEAQRAKRNEERRRYREERALKRKEERLRHKKAAAEKRALDNNERYKDRSGSGGSKGPPSSVDRKAKSSYSSRFEDAGEWKKHSERAKDFDKKVKEASDRKMSSNNDNDCHSSDRLVSKDVSHDAGESSGSCKRATSSEADAGDGDGRDPSSKLESSNSIDGQNNNGRSNSESMDRENTPEENNKKAGISKDSKIIMKRGSDIELGVNDEDIKTNEEVSSFMSNEDKKEECIKRRNSMEMYKDGKEENGEKHKRRESGRRSSLESGDQNVSVKSLAERRDQGKEESGDSKERLKEQGEDPRTKRRIRNKDRPSMEIYRPGMGRFSKQRLEKDKVGSSTEVDSPSPSPSPTPTPKLRHSNSNSSSQGRAT
ncbi:regulator of nonsense transcripts 3B [Nilaparvata lugens]|uniref:regulator of nonsense transcripts 3B n=1 Tax=Nilaparvata lugens TaxID=108931 RepID=UPI00193D9CA3|nr:regulator of nonsense transcripts 3B [Nilaparvata lugens]XP_039281646.1 regulator of nonsense transcripts 3B [Nilaparvata lugens]XP_039281654.1 regulator of nonsense transcripts 3B [Nilaparvata lugens]XP_039281659.1 regulator of nonsense transcripts 3B [Nilaparvata lugens]